jgi:hypothetical protein
MSADDAADRTAEATDRAAESATNSTHGATRTRAQPTAHRHLSWGLNGIQRRLGLVRHLLHLLGR